MSTHSSTSSDILGPPGDAEYLISSPVKPFHSRQHLMSPANFKLLQTPASSKGKRPRFSLSPTKSAHSVRFDDVLLPASPGMLKLNGQQRALSPDKANLDGNQSPWRIRVTLEATQDEETAEDSPARKRARHSTTTTKVPLKDESEQTPRRRRGRPRKSDALELHATPTPTPNTGSPGNTPGPGGSASPKRKRGRPRKSLLSHTETIESEGQTMDQQVAPVNQPEKEPPIEPENEPPREHSPPAPEPERSWSPLNLGADNGSDDDELPEPQGIDIGSYGGHEEEGVDEGHQTRSSPRVTFDTPNVDIVDDAYLRIGEPTLDSTPSKMPSPPRENPVPPVENTLHAGHTPMAPRRYPTPTSSSQVDEERLEEVGDTVADSGPVERGNGLHTLNDPTDDHREFDSIMESEGFSMVSLDTLPSAKQHGLSTSAKPNAKAVQNTKVVKGSLLPFLDRDATKTSKRRSPFARDDEEAEPSSNTQPDSVSVTERQQASSRSRRTTSNPPVVYPSLQNHLDSPHQISSGLDATKSSVPAPTVSSTGRTLLTALAKMVRAGIALGGVLTNSSEADTARIRLASDSSAFENQPSDLDAPIRRLKRLFSNFDPEIQAKLQAGLVFAQELATRRIMREVENTRRTTPRAIREHDHWEDDVANGTTTPQEAQGREVEDTPGTEMRRRMEEWQREREAISREIQMANSSRVIVIESDESGRPSPNSDAGVYMDQYGYQSVSDQESDVALEEYQEPQPEPTMAYEPADATDVEEEDGYEDIWQQEAHDQDNSHSQSSVAEEHPDGNQYDPSSSPGKSTERGQLSSPAYWTKENDKVPFLGQSRVKQLREQDVDLSGLLRAENTPNRSRYYYGKSSPFSTVSKQASGRSPSTAESQHAADMNGYEAQHDHLEPDHYLETSSRGSSDDDDFQIDPTTRYENSMHYVDSLAGDSEFENNPEAPPTNSSPVHETSHLTPERSHSEGDNVPASSWLQKIVNLTPGWLKAPKRKPVESESSVQENEIDDEDGEVSNRDLSYGVAEPRSTLMEEEVPEDSPRPQSRFAERSRQQRTTSRRSSTQKLDISHLSTGSRAKAPSYERPPPLAVSGYFSDEHYYLLRRLYRLAIKYPERFPYYPDSGRPDIIGDWIWTSDGAHGVPITERQFAIIDRFVQELAKGDIQAGGTGQVGWTDADLHKRLISVIIGEQIRAEAKEQQREEHVDADTRPRGFASRLWR